MGTAPSGVIALPESYRHCREVARRRARNFYYAFRLLDAQRRDSLCSIYAFMRRCDDLSDEPGATQAALEAWRSEFRGSLDGRPGDDLLWPAFTDTVKRYRIPHEYFHEMIDGVSSDFSRRKVATFEELYRYCYQVASVAGLSLVHIFGYRGPEALVLAEKCGIAFQLTNIIRDIGEDAALGRVYLPAEDLTRFEVSVSDLQQRTVCPALRKLLAFEADRARGYYVESRPLLELISPETRHALWALIEIYSRLLERIRKRDYEVLAARVRLSSLEKTEILLRGLLRRQ
jgi:phytoene synthase